MDLIDLLHINNDIMSYSLAFASLAYSLGGLLSGFLFNYVNRQILISAFYVVFGVVNILTPFISNYYVFSVLTVFKMMCAGGTDCGANVWMLELWPGKDAWLQTLHFSFAVGCALGPLVVEPFLSHDEHGRDGDIEAKLHQGGVQINDQNSESRIYIPYGVSGTMVLMSAVFIIWLYFLDEKYKKQAAKLRAKQQLASGEQILLRNIQHPAAIEAGTLHLPETIPEEAVPLNAAAAPLQITDGSGADLEANNQLSPASRSHLPQQLSPSSLQEPLKDKPASSSASINQTVANNLRSSQEAITQSSPMHVKPATSSSSAAPSRRASRSSLGSVHSQQQVAVVGLAQPLAAVLPVNNQSVKITSKAKEQLVGRPPYYVMFAIALAALCLSFYCGIEITSMNYLATFAVNIDLQLPKSTAALMSSALTISFAVGRAFGIWIAANVKPHKLFYLCAGIMATGNVFMLIFANTEETLLWCSICLFGIGCGPMFPAIVSFFDDKISKVTNTVSGIFILGSMFNVALNSLIIGHYIIDNALILIVCNLIGSVLLMLLFATLHGLTKVKIHQRVRKYKLQQQNSSSQVANKINEAGGGSGGGGGAGGVSSTPLLSDQAQLQAQQSPSTKITIVNEAQDISNQFNQSSSSTSSPLANNNNNNTETQERRQPPSSPVSLSSPPSSAASSPSKSNINNNSNNNNNIGGQISSDTPSKRPTSNTQQTGNDNNSGDDNNNTNDDDEDTSSSNNNTTTTANNDEPNLAGLIVKQHLPLASSIEVPSTSRY